MSQDVSGSYIIASQETKKSQTNACVSRRPIEFYVKQVFRQTNMTDEYNFYAETNINKLKLFLENFLNELTKTFPYFSTSSTASKENSLSASQIMRNNIYKDKAIVAIEEQLIELKHCLRHFANSLTEITKAESEYLKNIEKTSLFRIDEKYKLNKQVLFQESGNLVTFANGLINNLEILNTSLIKKYKASEEILESTLPSTQGKGHQVRLEDKETQTEASFTNFISSSSKEKEKSIYIMFYKK